MPSFFNPITNRYHEVDEQTAALFAKPPARQIYNPFTGRHTALSSEDEYLFFPEPTAPITPEPTDVEWADYGKSIMAGGASVAAGAGWLLDKLDGSMGLGEAIMGLGNRAVDYWNESLSDAAKRELAKEFITKTEDGYEWGDASLSTVGLFGAQSLLSTAAGAGIGAGATKVLQIFGNPIGRATLQQAVRIGKKARPGSRAATLAAQAEKKLNLVNDMVRGAAGFGIGEGTIGGSMAGVNVETAVRNLSDDKLLENPRFQMIYESTDGLLDERTRFEYARDTLAKEAGTAAGFQAGITTALLGAPMGAYFGPLFSKVASGAPGSILKGAAGEAAQEFAQSGVEQFLSNRQIAAAGGDVDPFFHVLNAAVGGALAGAPLGGTLATAQQAGEVRQQRQAEKLKVGGVNYAPLVARAREAKEAGASDEELLPIMQKAREPGQLLPAIAELRRLRDRKLTERETTAEPQEIPETAKPEQPAVPEGPVTTPEELEAVAQDAATAPTNDRAEPTEAQIEAGNYRKPQVKIPHLPEISIENPAGSKRRGKRPDGSEWEHELTVHYGYFPRTKGADDQEDGTPSEGVDVFVGDNATDASMPVFVIDQKNPDGSFDEHKVMVGFHNEDEARQGYLAQYDEGWDGLGAITPMPAEDLKAFLRDEARTSLPVAYDPQQVEAKPAVELVDEEDPLESIRADVAGETPERASLMVLRDMIEISTDVMNDGQFPSAIRKEAGELSERISTALESGEDLGSVQQEAAGMLREWLAEHDFEADAEPLRALQKRIEQQAPEETAKLPAVREQLFVRFGGQQYEVESFEDASAKWNEFVERTGAGASQLTSDGIIVDQAGKEVAQISYNGKVWPPGGFQPGQQPLYDPYKKPAPQRVEPAETPALPEGAPANPVKGTPLEKAKALHALGRENEPLVTAAIARIDAELGFKSKTSFKAIPTIIAKSKRPDFQRKNPGGGVEHIRDSFRFKSVLPASKVADIERAVAIVLDTGATILKSDFAKIANPGAWGWRMIAFDLRMPNGQIVEWYLPVTEMAAANSGGNHELFEKWRDKDPAKLSAPQRAKYTRDVEESSRRYAEAWAAAAASAGQSVAELEASFARLEASLPLTGSQPSSSSPTVMPSKGDQAPPDRSSQREPSSTSTSSPSRDLNTSSTGSIIPREPIPTRDIETDTAITPAGREVPVRYAVVEATDLIASQTDEGRVNPDYPADLQPRDRSRGVSQQQVQDISRNLNPRLLDRSPRASDGAPIIAPDGVVESGNGRVLAIRRAYAEGNADGYRQYLAEQGYPVEGVTQPVLVRVREGDLAPAERAAFTREANERDTLGLSATERAMADAAALPDELLELYRGGDVDTGRNRDFVRAFIDKVVSKNEQAGMIAADGAMSQEAIRRIEGALLAKAYGDPDLVATLIESADTNIRAIGGALMDIAASWAQMRAEAAAGRVDPVVDQTEQILEAVRVVQRARREGRSVAELVGQQDLLSGQTVSRVAEAFLRLMFRNTQNWTQPVGRDKMAGALTFYLDQAGRAQPGEDLLGESAPEPERVLNVARDRQYGQTAQQAGLFSQPPRGPVERVPEPGRDGDGPGAQEAAAAGEPEAERVGAERAPAEASGVTREALEAEIPYDVAYQAHSGTSFSPERRAQQEKADYANQLLADYEYLSGKVRNDAERATFEAEWARYHENFRRRFLAYLGARNGLVSSFIAGPARFPVTRMQKKNDTVDRRLGELLESRRKALASIIRKLRPELAPTRVGDEDAAATWQKKLKQREAQQERMKAVNKALRKGLPPSLRKKLQASRDGLPADLTASEQTALDAKLRELQDDFGLSETAARGIVTPDFMGRIGFADYQLSNNNAQIRRLKQQIERAERYQSERAEAGGVQTIEFDKGSIELDYDDNRIRVSIEKSDTQTRNKLKLAGFRWSPKNVAWQRQLTENAKAATVKATGAVIGPQPETAAEDVPEATIGDVGEEGPPQEEALRSRGTARGVPSATVTMKLADAIAAVSPLLTVRVVQSVSDLPGNVHPSDTEGAYFNRGAVYLVADNLSAARIEQVFRHEVFGHAAMERHPEFAAWLQQIQNARKIKGSEIQKLAAEVAMRQGLMDPVTEAKEIIALMAERGIEHSLMDKIIAAFRKFFRSIGLLKDVSAAEVRTWLAKGARQFMNDAELARRVPGATLTPESTDEEVLAAINAIYPGDTVDALYQRVFHGSPHRFDRFSLDAIGSGEGAQAYGYGLYFAENRNVASSYRTVNAGPVPLAPEQIRAALRDVDYLGFDTATQAILSIMQHPDWRARWDAQDASQVIDQFVEEMTPGSLYEAEIPDDVTERMLDWDAPLSDEMRDKLAPLVEWSPALTVAVKHPSTTGGGFYGALASAMSTDEGWRRMGELRAYNTGELASQFLREKAGIPGIKYLDQGSRNAGGWHITPPSQTVSGKWMVKSSDYNSKGLHFDTQEEAEAVLADKTAGETRNIVLFDPDLITEVRRDGEVVSTKELPQPSGGTQPLYSRAMAADDVEAAMARVMVTPREDLTVSDRVRLWWRDLTNMQEGRVKQGLLDSAHAVRLLEEGLFGEVLDATDSAHKAMLATKNLPSVIAAILKVGAPVLKDGVFQPVAGRKGIMDMFRRVTDHADGNLLAQWEFFAAANRASRLITEENRDGTLREKNFSPADIEKGLSLEKQYPFFREVLDEWTAFNSQILDVAEAAGVINAAERALWAKNDYVPFYRAMDEQGDVRAPGKGKGTANVRSGIRRLEGSEAALGSVFENMMMNVAHLIDASFRNVAMQRTVAMAEQTGAMEKLPPQWAPTAIDTRQIAKRLAEAGIEVGPLTKEQKESWTKLFRRVAPAGKDVVSVLVDGKPEYYRVHDPMLLSSITLMGQDSYSALMGLFRAPKRWLTTGVTATPEFMMANLIRDTLSTWVVSDIRKNPFKGIGSAMKATFTEDDDIMALMMAGAGGGGYYDSSPEDIRKLLSQKMPKGDVDGFLKSVLHPKHAWRWWQKVGASTENANRIAIFRQVIAQGGSVAEAAYQARDVLNFTMSGDFGAIRVLIQTVPFLNARIQGLYRLARGAKAHPKSFMAKGLILMGLTLALLARNHDEEEYEELPEWDKDTYWHIFVGGEHLRIPKPFEVGALFGTLPERLIRTGTDNADMELLHERVMSMLMDTFAFNPVPQLAKPIVEQYANRNMFTGSPIVGLSEAGLEPEAQYNAWTSETVRAFAEGLPDFAPEWLRSPRRLEAALRGYFGSLATYALNTSDALVRTLGGYPAPPEGTLYDLPVIQRFLRAPEPRQSRYADMLYDMLDESNQVFRTINRYRAQGLMDKARELQQENVNQLRVRARLNRIRTAVRKLNGQMKMVMFNRSLTPEQKRERLDVLQQRKNDLLAEVAPFESFF